MRRAAPALLACLLTLAGCAQLEEARARKAETEALQHEIAAIDRETWCGLYDPVRDRQYAGPPEQTVATPVYYTVEPLGMPDLAELGYDALVSKRTWDRTTRKVTVVQVAAAASGDGRVQLLLRDADNQVIDPDESARVFLDCLGGA